MEDEQDLERLLVQATIRNCQRKFLYCDPSERDLLLAIFNEANRELAEMDEKQALSLVAE
jgi:hypothetical protein